MSEIEEFLKRAAALRQQQTRGPQPPRSVPPPATGAPAPPARLVPAQPLRPAPLEVVDAEVIDAGDQTEDVAGHVQRHLGAGELSGRTLGATPLAESVRMADDVMEAHLHEAFEHRLGNLGAVTGRAEESTLDDEEAAAARAASGPVTTPLEVLQLLRSPQGMRHAIILQEILTPPTQRW